MGRKRTLEPAAFGVFAGAQCAPLKPPGPTETSPPTRYRAMTVRNLHAWYSAFPYTVVSFGDMLTMSSAASETNPPTSPAFAALM